MNEPLQKLPEVHYRSNNDLVLNTFEILEGFCKRIAKKSCQIFSTDLSRNSLWLYEKLFNDSGQSRISSGILPGHPVRGGRCRIESTAAHMSEPPSFITSKIDTTISCVWARWYHTRFRIQSRCSLLTFPIYLVRLFGFCLSSMVSYFPTVTLTLTVLCPRSELSDCNCAARYHTTAATSSSPCAFWDGCSVVTTVGTPENRRGVWPCGHWHFGSGCELDMMRSARYDWWLSGSYRIYVCRGVWSRYNCEPKKNVALWLF